MNELEDALAAYWAAAFSEGQRNATHDTHDGWAQHALDAVRSCVRDAIAAEREACAVACEAVHVRPIQGAHEEYIAGKEMALMQAASAIRKRAELLTQGTDQ